MFSIFVIEKTGFIPLKPDFLIYDQNMKIFYEGIKQETVFNLPKGSYFSTVELLNTSPRKFNFSFIKQPNKKPKNKKFSIIFAKNPNKASIFPKTGKIIFDNELKKDKTKLKFIFFHEIGHLFYKHNDYMKNEMAADIFAVGCMLKIGFNPSQIAKIPLTTISKRNTKRILNIFLLNKKL